MHWRLYVKIMTIPFRCFKYISDAGDPQEWTANASKGVDLFVEKLKEIL